MQNISAPELIKGFAETAPSEVQQAVRQTVVSLLGNLPPHVYDVNVMSTGQNVASLMYSMQMTGYMFRNAEYRRSLLSSLEPSDGAGAGGARKLPSVSGRISVERGGRKAEVDAAAYMAELRAEVEGLRAQLAAARTDANGGAGGAIEGARGEGGESGNEGALVSYIATLAPSELRALTSEVSEEVLQAMGELIGSILAEADVPPTAVVGTTDAKMRELLVWQLVTGYKLRELEVKAELRDKFWGA